MAIALTLQDAWLPPVAPRPSAIVSAMATDVAIADLDDAELVEQARSAGPTLRRTVLGELYRRHYRRVASWCLALCSDRVEAEDLAQEVFLKVHRSIDGFRGNSRFTTWLYTITRRSALDRARAARLLPSRPLEEGIESEEPSEPPEALGRLAQGEAAARLRWALSRLDPVEARVLVLHYVNGWTLPAITEGLGLENRSGAKAFVVGGLRKLRRLLDPAELTATELSR